MADEVELYRRYRPETLDDVFGQPEAVRVLKEMIKRDEIPHAILFSGPSGTGKTTMARILRRALQCSDTDFCEINCASCEPMETVREIQGLVHARPWSGPARVWLLDETQSMSRAAHAQQGLLKILEDTPRHAYFFLACTEPGKLIAAIKTRCTEIVTKPLDDAAMRQLLGYVCGEESIKLSGQVTDKLIESAAGSPRMALVNLGKIRRLADDAARLAMLAAGTEEDSKPVHLARLLMNNRSKWSDITDVLQSLTDRPEDVRRAVLGYANAVLMKSNNPRAACILSYFGLNFYDSEKAGLTYACYQVFGSK